MSTVNNNRGRTTLNTPSRTTGGATPSTTTPSTGGTTPRGTTTPVDPSAAGRVPTTDAATATTLPTGTGGRAGANSPINVRAGANEVVGSDGTLFPGVTGEDRQMRIMDLAMPAEPGTVKPGAFDKINSVKTLEKVAVGLAADFKAVTGQPPNDATALAWRQLRASCLHLLEQAALRASKLGGEVAPILKKTVEVIKSEPNRALRDFAFESLLSHAEAKALPEVKEARALLYPESMPYADWPKRVKVVRYCDDDGSKIEDNIWFFKEMMGAKHTANADGSHTFLITKRGAKHEIEVTIPPKSAGLNIVEHVGDKNVQVIEYCGHAGHGNFFEKALASGTKGTGAGQVMAGYQCWGEGNTETLERQCPDLQYLSTTEMTSDNYDFVMQQHFFEAILQEKPWDAVMKGAIKDLKRDYPEDISKGELKVDTHYLPPTNRGRLLTHYDRDGDGVRDGSDHIFNVIYPKRVDTTGGYDPVVQDVPRFALDGTELSKSVNALTLVIRYDHILTPAQEAKVGWVPEKWQPGGFFEPAADDLRAFRFTRTPEGDVRVALSTRFAHTPREDLQRMMAVEAGLWVGREAGLTAEKQGALAVTMLQRIVDGQGEWFSKEDGLLDEFWAEEQMLFSRYGLKGFSISDVSAALNLGDHGDFKPENFERATAFLKQKVPNLAELATRAPTRVGEAVAVPKEGVSLMDANNRPDLDKLGPALKDLGIQGTFVSSDPRWLPTPPAAINVLVTMEDGGKKQLVGVALDNEGRIRNVARLSFDFAQKLNGAVMSTLAQLATSGGLTVSDAQRAYETAKAGNPQPLDAMVAAARILRQNASPAAVMDGFDALESLPGAGVADAAKVQEASTALSTLFPTSYQVRGEGVLWGALSSAPELKNKLAAITKKYNDAVLAGNGNEASWKAAAAVLVDAVPARMTVPRETDLSKLLTTLAGDENLKPARGKLVKALGLKPEDLAVLAMRSQLRNPGDTAAAEKELRAVFKKTGDLGQALVAGLDVLRVAGLVSSWSLSGNGGLDAVGAVEDPAALAKVSELMAAAQRRVRVETELSSLVSGAAPGRTKEEVAKQFREAFARKPDLAKAAAAVLTGLPKAAAPKVMGGLDSLVSGLEDAEKPAMIKAVLNALGLSTADAVLAQKKQQLLTTLEGTEEGPGAVRAYETAFNAATRAGKPVVDAMAAAGAALLPVAVRQESSMALRELLGESDLLSEAELKTLGERLAPTFTAYNVAGTLADGLRQAGALNERTRKQLADAVKEGDAMAGLVAAAGKLKRPAGAPAPDGGISLSGLMGVEDKAQRLSLAKDLFRITGRTPEAYLKEQIKNAFEWHFADSSSPEAAAARAEADACFKPGVSLADATVAAVEKLTKATESGVRLTLTDFAKTGLMGDLDVAAFEARLTAATTTRPPVIHVPAVTPGGGGGPN